MYPDRNTSKRHADLRPQRGFSIVSAIFLLVILASLGAFMVTFSVVQHTSSAQDLQGARAYQAARAGVEWGEYQILQVAGAGFAANCRATGVAGTSQTLPALAGTLAGFNVVVTCVATSYAEGDRIAGVNPVWIYRIGATAQAGTAGQANFVQRQIQATIGQ